MRKFVIVILLLLIIGFTINKMPWTCVAEQEVTVLSVKYEFYTIANSRDSLRQWKQVRNSEARTRIFYSINGKETGELFVFNSYEELKEGDKIKLILPSSCEVGYFPWSDIGYLVLLIELLLLCGVIFLMPKDKVQNQPN